jgi:polysaccharide export outer membrane protein
LKIGLVSMMRKAYLVAALFAVSGCGGTPQIALAPTVERAPQDVLPTPSAVGPGGEFTYALGPLDTISIEVDGMPDLLREVVVDGQGMISYPMAGSVPVSGLTTTELARQLEARMRENHVRNPRVNVNFVTPVSNVITVDGEVGKPGLFPVYRKMTLMQAVALAEGDTDFARPSVVLIFRQAQGREYVGLYNLKAIRYGNYADPPVYPGDRIVVSESEARRFLQTIQPLITLLTTPLIYLVRR